MRYELKSYNDFAFLLEVVSFGSGVTGLSPKISIKQFGSANYWDGAAWSAVYTEFTMTATDAVNQPGLYYYDFMPGIDTTVGTKYLVKMTDIPSLITEYVFVTLNRFDNITSNNRIIPQNISDFMNAAVGYSLPLSTLGNVTLTATTTSVTNDVNANIVDWNSTGATLTKDGVTSYPQVAIASGTVDANVVDWNSLGATLSINAITNLPDVSISGTVDSNVVDWNSTGATLTVDATTNLPDVSVSGTIDANVVDWNSTGATLTVDATTNLPDVSITDVSVDAIAGAVWDSTLSSHLATDTFGYLMQIIAGLTHYNHRIKDTTYDQSGRLTACRIVVYTNAADADADTNELAKIVVTSTYNASNNMLSYVAKKE